jgi:hypothetical protein
MRAAKAAASTRYNRNTPRKIDHFASPKGSRIINLALSWKLPLEKQAGANDHAF